MLCKCSIIENKSLHTSFSYTFFCNILTVRSIHYIKLVKSDFITFLFCLQAAAFHMNANPTNGDLYVPNKGYKAMLSTLLGMWWLLFVFLQGSMLYCFCICTWSIIKLHCMCFFNSMFNELCSESSHVTFE